MSRHDCAPAPSLIDRVTEYVPEFVGRHRALGPVSNLGDLVLIGSLTMGIVDQYSDVDTALVLPVQAVAQVDAASPSRYFEFHLDGRQGSVIVESIADWRERVDACDLPLIARLRRAVPIRDNTGETTKLIARARQEMKRQVRRAFFFYHYFEMRSYHKTADNTMNRHDPVATYINVGLALQHAIRACLCLEAEPYPYDKWLWMFASTTPTGKKIAAHVDRILDLMADDVLRFPGPESRNPLSKELKAIRAKLIDSARQSGISEPWLDRWWEHINRARSAPLEVRW